MLLILGVVLLILYYIFTQSNISQSGGSLEDKEPPYFKAGKKIARRKSLIKADNSMKVLNKNDKKITKDTKTLEKINKKLNHNGELNNKDHKKLQKIARKTKKIKDSTENIAKKVIGSNDHIKLTKHVLSNHNDRLHKLEKYICQLRSEAGKNQNVLSDISNKLKDSVADTEAASVENVNERKQKKQAVQETSRVIKNNCPVCPMYSETNPVNILEVTGQGFGTIAPATLGPNYI